MVDTLKFCEIQTVEPMLSPTIEKSLCDIINNEGFVKQNTFKRSISTNGGNYLGDLFEVDIKGNTEYGEKETNLFIKKIIAPKNCDLLSIPEMHSREITLYKEILPLYSELENEANIPKEERFKQIKFYDANIEALIFDNLAKKGFKTMGRMETISLEYAKKGICQLAKYHALSFALEAKRPDYFNKTVKKINHFFENNDNGQKFTDNIFEFSCSLVEGEVRKKLEAAKSTIIQKYNDLLKTSPRVLCHGDYRVNNILHKEINGEVTELIPIDYQVIYYGNPLNDFIYFTLPSSDTQFRRDHLLYLKDLYYNELSKQLNYFGIKVESVYPRKDFEAEFKERYYFGLMCCMQLLPFLFSKKDALPGFDQNLTTIKYVVEDGAKDRIRGIVEDYIRWDLI